MRKQCSDGITILKSEQRTPKNIDFDALEADITVLAHQPGIGKTYAVMQYMQEQPDAFYFTDRHDTIDEIIADMGISGLAHSHWEGFERKCEWPHAVNARHEYGLPIDVLCQLCKRDRCAYAQQFDERERVFAPYEHLKIKHVEPYPRIAFLDENKLAMDTLRFDRESVVEWMRSIGVSDLKIERMESGVFTSTTSFYLGKPAVSVQQHKVIQAAIEDEVDEKHMQHLVSHSTNEIWDYLEWARRYDDYERDYHIPLYYHAFDLARKGVPLVFLDATLHRKFFQFLLEAYNGEIGFGRDITVQIYKSAKQNKSTHVYRLRPRGYRPRRSYNDYRSSVNKWLTADLERIKRIFGDGNMGLIGHKKVIGNPLINGEYFGNLRSSNKLADKDALVVLGTFAISEDEIKNAMAKLLYKPLEDIEDEVYSHESEERCGAHTMHQESEDGYLGGNDGSSGTPIYMAKWLQQLIFDSEMYQAYHRNRGLRHDRTIITYGLVPPQIEHEFSVEIVPISKEERFWQQLREQHKNQYAMQVLGSMISDLEQGDSATAVARRYKIWRKGGGVDTQVVKTLQKLYETLKKQAKK